MHEFEQKRGGRPALGRRREDHRVAALERIDDLVGRCRARIGRRRDRGHDAYGARNLDDPESRVFGNHPDRLRALEVAQQAHRLTLVLDDLVGDVSEARVTHRKLGETPVVLRLDDRPACRGDDFVDLRLVVALVESLRHSRALDEPGYDVSCGRSTWNGCHDAIPV